MIGGRGGNGCLSFLSEAHHEFAGPDGGNGGNGGHVIFQGKISVYHMTSLLFSG